MRIREQNLRESLDGEPDPAARKSSRAVAVTDYLLFARDQTLFAQHMAGNLAKDR